MAVVVACAVGCGPSVETPEDGGGSGTSSSAGTGVGADSTDGDGSSGGPIRPPAELPGLTIEDVRHGYMCIDGCESFYSTEDLRLTLTASETSDVVVQLHDWTFGDRELSSDDDPIMEAQAHLEAGSATEVELRDDRTGYCSMEDWSEPVRVLLLIDGAAVEVDGHSGAGYGWDC